MDIASLIEPSKPFNIATGLEITSIDPNDAIARLKAALPKIANVIESPVPDVLRHHAA